MFSHLLTDNDYFPLVAFVLAPVIYEQSKIVCRPPLIVNSLVLQDYAQCRFDAYLKQKKLYS